MDGASTDRAIGAGQDWAAPAFRRGLNQGAAAGAVFNAVGAAAIFGGAALFTGASIEMGATGLLTKFGSSGSLLLRLLGLVGTASSTAVKGCSGAPSSPGGGPPALSSTIPQISSGTNREMLGQAVRHVAALQGTSSQKAELFAQLAQQINKLSGGSWAAARSVGADCSHIFAGTFGESLVVSPAGQLFRGSLSHFTFGTGGTMQPICSALKQFGGP